MRRKRQRDTRHRETKVWRDPLLSPMSAATQAMPSSPGEDDASRRRRPTRVKRDVRIVAGPVASQDPNEIECDRLLKRVLVAEGRPSISRAVEDFIGAGFALPPAQEVWLQVLEHRDEERVTEAIEKLAAILADEQPKRRKVLESRLRRIEEFADEASTKRAATDLRRVLNTRYAETLT